jgi:hypothetical protein
MYVGLWSRLEGFTREELTRALERRTVVQATLMRTTIHLVSRRDYWPFALGTRDARRQWWLRVHRGGPGAAEMAAAARALGRRLAAGPLRRAELDELVGKPHALGVGLWIDLVRAPPSGTWERRRADLYAAAEHWLGPPKVTADEGAEHLVRRYLGGFGPASLAAIADWAGLPLRAVAAAVERLRLSPPATPAPRPRSWSTAPWRGRGATSTAASDSSPSGAWTARHAAHCARRPTAWPTSTPES